MASYAEIQNAAGGGAGTYLDVGLSAWRHKAGLW